MADKKKKAEEKTPYKPRTQKEFEDYYTTKPGDLIKVELDPREEPTHTK